MVVAGQDGVADGRLVFRREAAAPARLLVPLHRHEHTRRLGAAHHRDAPVGPHPEQARVVGAAAHAVVAGAEGAADDDAEPGHDGVRDRVHHLRPVLGDPGPFVLAADHEPGDVLEEDQRDPPQVAQLDEMGRLEGRFREEDAVVGEDSHEKAVEAGEAGDQGRTVAGLELVEAGAVDEPGDHLAHVVLAPEIGADDAADLTRIVSRVLGRGDVAGRRLDRVQRRDDGAGRLQRLDLVPGEVVGDPRQPRVDVGAPELLGRDVLAGRRLHEGRPAEKDGARAFDDDRLVGHRRHVGAAGRARAQDHGDLRYARRRQPGLVEEDASEVLPVREYLGLHRKKGAAGIDQIDARQPVLERDLLRSQVLLDGDGKVGAPFDGGIVGHHHHLAAAHAPDARDEPGPRRLVVVHAAAGQRRQLEKGGVGVEQMGQPDAHRKLALLGMPAGRRLAAPLPRPRPAGLEIALQRLHRAQVGAELLAAGIDASRQDMHGERAGRVQRGPLPRAPWTGRRRRPAGATGPHLSDYSPAPRPGPRADGRLLILFSDAYRLPG